MRFLSIILCLTLHSIVYSQNWDWVQTINGGGNNYAWDIVTDNQGNVIACGRVKFDVTFGLGGTAQPSSPLGDQTDIFLVKFSPSGDLLWYRRSGNVNPDWARSVTVDSQDNIYMTGDFCEIAVFENDTVYGYVNGQTGPNSMARSGFVAKYDPNGSLFWVKSFQSTGHTRGYGIAVDSSNAFVYLTGYTTGICDFGNGVTTGDSIEDLAFIAKYNANGDPIWADYVISQYYSRGNDIQVVNDSTIIVTGSYNKQMTYDGMVYPGWSPTWGDVFTMCIDSSGGHQWVRTGIGPHFCEGRDIAIDEDENVYVVGRFSTFMVINGDTIDALGIGTNSTEWNARGDAFLVKYDINGNQQWFKHIGNQYTTDFNGITRYDNKVVITGMSVDTIFFPGYNDTLIPVDSNHNAMFIAYDLDGNYEWSKLVSSTNAPKVDYESVLVSGSKGLAISADKNHNLYASGYFKYIANFDSNPVSYVQDYDAYIAKLFPPLESVVDSVNGVCPGDSIEISIYSYGSPLNYNWTSSIGTILSTNGNTLVIEYPIAGVDNLGCVISNGYTADTISLTINVDASNCLGIGGDSFSSLAVFPNPSQNVFKVCAGEVEIKNIQIHDIYGKCIFADRSDSISNQIDLSKYPSGTYFLYVEFSNQQTKCVKLIKL